MIWHICVSQNIERQQLQVPQPLCHLQIQTARVRHLYCLTIKNPLKICLKGELNVSLLKFINSEKATKFYEIFPLLLTGMALHKRRRKVKISQNF